MNLNDLRKKRHEILALAEKHGAGNVRVFGSVARGEAGTDSDVDFLIDIVDISRFVWGGGGLLVELEALLKRDVDLVTEQDIHWLIREQVVHEAIEL